MAEIEIKLKDGVTGKAVDAELPDDVPIRDLLPAITNELGINDADERRLINKTQSFEYDPDDTLAGRATVEGDTCLLTYEPIFGALATPLPPTTEVGGGDTV